MDKVEKKVSDSVVEMTQMVLPQHTNALGTAFGGSVLSWIDIAAAIAAQRHCRKTVVTASIDAMHFLAPIKLGWVVNIKASVNYAFKTSCEVGVKVVSENPLSNEHYHTASAYLTMVALDGVGRPATIPQIIPETEKEISRHKAALMRRNNRLELREAIRKKR